MTDHFLTLDSLGAEGIREILDLSHRFKREPGRHREALAGGRVGMIFDKPSTRTRVSLEDAAWALGMLPIVLRPDELQLGHGETVADTARVLSRYLSALTIRTFAHARVEELAAHSTIPIINALTDDHHPCQALADVMTLEEVFGDLRGRRVAFIGDGNNVAHSLIQAAGYLGFTLADRDPGGLPPRSRDRRGRPRRTAQANGGAIELVDRARRGGRAAPTRSTPTCGPRWARSTSARSARRVFAGYTVDAAMMARAAAGARSSSTASRPIAATR